MVELGSAVEGLQLLADPFVLLMMMVGVFLGISLGAIPGLTGTLGIAVMLPIAFTMNPLAGMIFLLAIYTGSMFGSAITAILVNTPGSPAAIATTFDGYPMTLAGRGLFALGMAVGASTLGTLASSTILIVAIQPLANFALGFGPAEMFIIAVLGLVALGAVSQFSFPKTLLAGGFGFVLGTIGLTSGGVQRGTFGRIELIDGIPLVPALVGMFAIAEIFFLAEKRFITGEVPKFGRRTELWEGVRATLRHPVTVIRSAIVGTGVGALPGAGGSIGSIVSWSIGRRFSRTPKEFGRGSREGLISAEAANSATEDGSLGTMLVLGIPGSPATAMLMGAIIMYGWVPGPRLFIDNADVLYGVLFAQFGQGLLLLPIGLGTCLLAYRLISVPTSLLVPAIAVFSVIGAYAIRAQMFDVSVMLGFGLLGYFLRRTGFPPIAAVLGLVLGPIADRQFIRASEMVEGGFFELALSRPRSIGLLILIGLFLLGGVVGKLRRRQDREPLEAAPSDAGPVGPSKDGSGDEQTLGAESGPNEVGDVNDSRTRR